MVDKEKGYVVFTEKMKETHTVLGAVKIRLRSLIGALEEKGV